MKCTRARRLLDSAGDRRGADLRDHLAACPACRAVAEDLDRVLASLAAVGGVRLGVDVTARVMEGVQALGPVSRRGLGRAGRWILGLALGGLVLEGGWTAWVLVGRGEIAQAAGPLLSFWEAAKEAWDQIAAISLHVLGLVSGFGDLALSVVDALRPLLPFWFEAAFVGLFLLMIMALGLARPAVRPLYGVTR